ncbi:speckle-type POZ protein-like [Paramacrobiotus metropolitanus]|uniref:speckle-type POZ protein-like n=1 Tax=Paramacrobiotus metropolitanus TaxID=2943436 RepID=UPI0024463BFC|nr:speckle-type POZ protein-like [Paramacrobiotus metropolitanus]
MTTQRHIVISEQTDQKIAHFTLKWTFDHFASYRNDAITWYNSGITMAELGFDEPMQGRWCIGIKPCHTVADWVWPAESRFLGIALGFVDSTGEVAYNGPRQLHAEFHVRLTTGEGSTLLHEQHDAAVFLRGQNVWRNDCFIRQDRLLGTRWRAGLIRDNLITVVMDIKMHDQPHVIRIPELAVTSLCTKAFLQRQRECWQSEQHRDLADFVLRANDGTVFRTHRFLLAAHSPVFAAMFTHDFQEKQNCGCEMADMDRECVEVLLAYVYACDVSKVTVDNAEKILIMADKYEIMDLRGVCENILASNVLAQNADHFLELASQRQLPVLQHAAGKAAGHASSLQQAKEKKRANRLRSLFRHSSA